MSSTLPTDTQILIEQRVTNEAQSVVVAYILWAVVGWFGGHRFYLGKTGSAVAMVLMTLFGFLTFALFIGIPILMAVAIWIFIDAFLIPGMVTNKRNALRDSLTSDALIGKSAAAPPLTNV